MGRNGIVSTRDYSHHSDRARVVLKWENGARAPGSLSRSGPKKTCPKPAQFPRLWFMHPSYEQSCPGVPPSSHIRSLEVEKTIELERALGRMLDDHSCPAGQEFGS